MAYLCGKRFKKKVRHGCLSGSGMYSPDAYIVAKKSSSRRTMKKKKIDDAYGFLDDEWARDNEAIENDSCYVYDGGVKPKKLNLVESILIEEDCSWLTPRSCQSLPKSTRGSATVDKWKAGSLKRDNRGKQYTSIPGGTVVTNGRSLYTGTPQMPLKDVHNRKQISCKKSPSKDTQNRKPKSCIKTPITDIDKNRKQVSFKKSSLTDTENKKKISCMSPEKYNQPKPQISCTKRPLTEIQNRKKISSTKDRQHKPQTYCKKLITNTEKSVNNPKACNFSEVDYKKKDSNKKHLDDNEDNNNLQDVNSTHSKLGPTSYDFELAQLTNVKNEESPELVQPSYIGIVNAPKPHVVLSETVKKENIKCRLMYCGNLPEKKSLFAEETLPEDQHMSLEELETTKMMQEHALKGPVLPICDDSVAISGHLMLTMSLASDATGSSTIQSTVEDSNSKKGCHLGTSSTDITNDASVDSILTPILTTCTGVASTVTSPTDTTYMADTSNTFTTSMGDTLDIASMRSVSSMGTTFTNVTPMAYCSTDLSSIIISLPNTPSSMCLPSYVDDNHIKFYSPTLVQLKMKKKKSVAKLVKAFEHLDCKKTTYDLSEVQPMVTTDSEGKKFEKNRLTLIPAVDVNKNINDLAFQKDSKCDRQDQLSKCDRQDQLSKCDRQDQLQHEVTENTSKVDKKKLHVGMPSEPPSCQLNFERLSEANPGRNNSPSESNRLDSHPSMGHEQGKESFKGEKRAHKVPDKLARLWSASMLEDYTSKDFNVGQGIEVIVMNEDDPKWLYVQVAIAVNGPASLKQKTAGFVPRSLVVPRFASPATRSSLDSQKKSQHSCSHHIRTSSNPAPLDTKERVEPQNSSTTDSSLKETHHKNRVKIQSVVKQSKQSDQGFYEVDVKHSESFSTDSLIIESYIVIKDHKPQETDEVEVISNEVIVVHAGQQRELDWMWVYVPRAERFGYIPAFCARPMALEYPM